MKKKFEIPNLKAPKGFRFKIVDKYGSVRVRLLRDGKEVGHITMFKAYPYKTAKKLETHSWLNADLRGKGIGTLLYSKAIEWGLKHKYRVASSGDPSGLAQRVWNGKSIRTHFHIRRRQRRSYGYTNDRWYAYPKPAPKKTLKRKGEKHGQKRRV